MSPWLLPLSDLTPDQLRAVEMDATVPRVIIGPPGSGKTQVLLHRAAYLRDRYTVPADRYRIFVFGNVLKAYIKSGMNLLKLPEQCVCTFDKWCAAFYRRHVGPLARNRETGQNEFFANLRRGVLQAIEARRELQYSLDFAVVDEGQDLTVESFQILRHAARHVSVFADDLQRIYERCADEAGILQALKVMRPSVVFLGAYRNSPDVGQLASYFIEHEEKRRQYLAQIRHNQAVRERPLMFVAKSMDEEMDRLAEVVRQRQVMNQRVAVIVPKNSLVHDLAWELEDRGVEVEKAVPQQNTGWEENREAYSFDNSVPKIAVYHSIKGLTFDCVLLPQLTEDAFYGFTDETIQRLLFVGIARATQWVYLSTLGGYQIEEFSVFEEAQRNQHLTVQYGTGAPAGQRSLFEDYPSTGDDEDLSPL